jgi:nucleoside-diphosphate-sugar epimerase
LRILVIGGTNFIGPPVVRQLHRQGHQVTVYHRGVHEPELPSAVRHIHDPRATLPILHFPSSLTDPAPDVVLHMFPVGDDDARAVITAFAGRVRRIVAISSGDVYRAYGRLLGLEPGPPDPVPLTEDAPLRTVLFPYRRGASGPDDWTYHYEKILVERALLAGPIPATILRLPAVYGPGDPYRRFRPYIKRMEDRRPGILLEAAQARWRWSHGYVEDVARAIAGAVMDERATGRVYNVGESVVPTMAERVERISRLMEWRGSIAALPAAGLPGHLRPPYQPTQDLVFDTRRIRTELGFSDSIPADEALRRTIAWERANPPESGDPGPELYAAEEAVLSAAYFGTT